MKQSRGGELTQFDLEIKKTFYRQRNTIEREDNRENSDTEEHLNIIQSSMDHVGAVEKPMMDYPFPTTDGMISSIALPTIQANNFEIKLFIIQNIRSSVQFSGLPEEDPNKHLSNFFKLDRESLYDALEHFKGMLRRCSHHELPLWWQSIHYFGIYFVVLIPYVRISVKHHNKAHRPNGTTVQQLDCALDGRHEINCQGLGLERSKSRTSRVLLRLALEVAFIG
ncbi:UNVERIFIED_CONTAM: hypothetical protein Sradi_7191600 [Sesamum radiatum]|uniref:Uncharacterized protein n=1 Tax=Sesamum radiatum TaxID=300843 RepID=A0AAW2IQD0_SESRA